MTQVKEIMTPAVVKLDRDTTLCDATVLMSLRKVSGAPVVDKDDRLVGMLSESDVLEFAASKEGVGLDVEQLSVASLPYDRLVRDEILCSRYKSVGEAKVGDVMNTEVVTIAGDEDIEKAMEIMVRMGFNRLPVHEDGKLIGIIARQDILVALCRDVSGRRSPSCPPTGR
ncbi:MAG: CBS domain-containing protein [Methanomassiliicoccus sp.]|nr:CBS domain-containing protein [Methanomassiliicoccus sp.]